VDWDGPSCSERMAGFFLAGRTQAEIKTLIGGLVEAMVRVKICGITSLEDAAAAYEAGADALGFLFTEGPRHVSLEAARAIISEVPAFVSRVGVFANAPLDTVQKAVREFGLDHVQLHGQEPPGFCEVLGNRAIKAFRVKDKSILHQIMWFPVIHILLDARDDAGDATGLRHAWRVARGLRHQYRVILGGGLTPENVAKAVAFARPWAVDVCHGVEARPGVKDPRKMRAFIQRAKQL
jgi:phosphoribosylanthranilate isomerase